jgi:hypothetical protein
MGLFPYHTETTHTHLLQSALLIVSPINRERVYPFPTAEFQSWGKGLTEKDYL